MTEPIDVSVSGHSVVVPGMTEVTTETEDAGQSVTDGGQPVTVATIVVSDMVEMDTAGYSYCTT